MKTLLAVLVLTLTGCTTPCPRKWIAHIGMRG